MELSRPTRALGLIVAALTFAGSASSATAADPQRPPNLLIILADDLGRGEYGAFGTKDVRTPHVDRLFAEGMAFDNFYANSPVCSPTRAALLTGRYPDRVGVPGVIRDESPANSWGYLSPAAVLLPAALKPAGYHSALVGKWHLGTAAPNTPTDRGFDLFRGFLGDMMDDYWTHRRNGHNYMRHNAEVIDPPGHATDLFTDWACEYLRSRATAGQPFFLYLAYNAPHDPLHPPPEWLERVRAREPGMDEKRAKLVALIEHMDAGIGRVVAALDETKLAGDTLVVFTSDNGGVVAYGANNGPFRSGKQHVYEGGLRVPFVARWPGRVPAGSRTDRVALTMDLFPTALAAAGLTPPAGIDGVSLLSTLRGEAQPAPDRSHYFVRREGGPAYGGKTIEALRSGDWKLVQDSPFAPYELYNLKEDPMEANDLAATQKKVLADMRAKLQRQIQRAGNVPWQQSEK